MINTRILLFFVCIILQVNLFNFWIWFIQYAYSSNLGVYRGPAPYGPQEVPVFEQWLGRNVSWALDFTAGSLSSIFFINFLVDTWSSLEGGSWQLGPWSTWVAQNPGKKFMLSVGMVPNTPTNVTYAAGAAGAYNVHWTNLAKNLVAYNLSSIYLRYQIIANHNLNI